MSSFQHYSVYYNLLYENKNYRAEAIYIDTLIQEWNPGAKTILNLGCGTGKHDVLLAEMGYTIVAVDLSETMIEIAKLENSHPNIDYRIADVRSVEVGAKFDAVISLFHVMSYQTTRNDLRSAFYTAKKHLDSKGVFLFDCWYGPGVETDPPKHVIKNVENEKIRVFRKTTPHQLPEQHLVNVQFDVQVEDIQSGTKNEFQEMHPMRYWYNEEIKEVAEDVGLSHTEFYKWMTREKPKRNDWYTVNILQ